MNRSNLIYITYQKEITHWVRMGYLFHEMKDLSSQLISYPILVILVSIFHYTFALMHFLFEVFMWIFFNKEFKQNMISSLKKIEITKNELHSKYKMIIV